MDFYIDMTEVSPESRDYIIDFLEVHGAPSPGNGEVFRTCTYWVFRRIGGGYVVRYSNIEGTPTEAYSIEEVTDILEMGRRTG